MLYILVCGMCTSTLDLEKERNQETIFERRKFAWHQVGWLLDGLFQTQKQNKVNKTCLEKDKL